MTYKPFTDLELSAVVPEFGVTLHDADRLIEQARRANRLAEAVSRYETLPDSIVEALAAYRGES